MQDDPFVERQRLAENYSKMYDDELLNLAADVSDLTEAAQQVLRQEMQKRGLGDPQAPVAARPAPEPRPDRRAPLLGNQGGASQLVVDTRYNHDEGDQPQEFTWKTLLCECETTQEAKQLSEALRQAGIESWIEGPRTYSRYSGFEVTNPRVMVAADQLEAAREILAQPIPKEIAELSQSGLPDFESPVCPICGAKDPALEGVDPFNTWRCEACGNQWTDSVAGLAQDPDKPE